MKLSLFSIVCIAFLLFVNCGFLGYIETVRLSSRYHRWKPYPALAPEEGRRLQKIVEDLNNFEVSRIFVKDQVDSPDSFERSIMFLKMHETPTEIEPMIDLRVAAEHAVLSELYQDAMERDRAASHRETAQSMLRGLGWKDVSPEVLRRVADKEMQGGFLQ